MITTLLFECIIDKQKSTNLRLQITEVAKNQILKINHQ